jgi:hypothetical protein
MRSERAPGGRNWHSHMMSTFHPFIRNAAQFSASRWMVRFLFLDQNSGFVAGFKWPREHECVCQKQPWTKITFLRPRNTRSGVPGRSRLCRLYRNPKACTSLRTAISGRVFVLRIAAMHLLRWTGVRESTIRALTEYAL